MLPSSRMIAQIDRAHLAVWLGPEISEASAAAEASALTYALSDRLVEGEREILPEITLRSARFDAAQATPQAAVSRTLAAFAVPGAVSTNYAAVDSDLAAHTREQFAIEQDLRQAIVRGELHLAFQPLIDAENGRVCGAEALVRWKHRDRGDISPGQFIPIMEAAGITQEISLWVLNQALREARVWRAAGCNGLRVAVNLSGRDLEEEALPLLIERTLARHGLTPDALEIELTESVALADGDRAAQLCQAMRSMGVAVAIDDFGTGYSSMGALRSLSFDKLKIDRSFVTNVDQRRDSQAICGAMLALGRGLGIRVLAEGVETAAEYQWLRAQGCRFFQGYYFALPMSSAHFVDFVRDPAPLKDLLARSLSFPAERLHA
jgi:Amt family ammonium transporter